MDTQQIPPEISQQLLIVKAVFDKALQAGLVFNKIEDVMETAEAYNKIVKHLSELHAQVKT